VRSPGLDNGAESYELDLCETRWSARANTGRDPDIPLELAGGRLPRRIALAAPARLTIKVKDFVASVLLDGAPLGWAVMSDQTHTRGRVSLGLVSNAPGTGDGGLGAAFANLRVTSD
jgi:hypothetical protein